MLLNKVERAVEPERAVEQRNGDNQILIRMEPMKTKDMVVHTDNWPTANEQILIKAREYGEAGQELKIRRQIAFAPPNESAVDDTGQHTVPQRTGR